MTLNEYVDYCLVLAAQTGEEPLGSPVLDAQRVVEVLFPAVMSEVVRRSASDISKLAQLTKLHTVAFAAGVGTLPAGVTEEYAEMMQIEGGLYAWYPHYFDFTRETDRTLPRFTLRSGQIYVETGVTATTPFTGNLSIAAVTAPQAPALATDQIAVSESILDDCMLLTASILKGETRLAGFSTVSAKKPKQT